MANSTIKKIRVNELGLKMDIPTDLNNVVPHSGSCIECKVYGSTAANNPGSSGGLLILISGIDNSSSYFTQIALPNNSTSTPMAYIRNGKTGSGGGFSSWKSIVNA